MLSAPSGHPSLVRLAFLCLVVTAALAAACEKPDASYVTSPSIKALIGTTTGNTAFNPPEAAPEPKEAPQGWDVDFNLARWTKLENGSPALEIIMQVQTRPGAGFELWVSDEQKTVARWSGGSTAVYVGTACFQLELRKGGEAVPLTDAKYHATVAFRDPASGVIAAKRIGVTNFVPKLQGDMPTAQSEVFREAYACPRGQ